MLAVLESQPVAAGENRREARADVAGNLGTAEEDDGVVEEGSIGGFDGLQLVHETGDAGTQHFIAMGQGDDVGIRLPAIPAALVVDVMRAPRRRPGLAGPVLVLVVVRPGFAAQALGRDPRHVGLEGEHDQVGHQLDVLPHAVADFALEANLGGIEIGPPMAEDLLLLYQPLLDVADRVEIVVDPLLIDPSQLSLQVADIFHRRVENAPIVCQSGLRLLDLGGVGGREQILEHAAIVVGRRNVDALGVPGESGGAHAARPRQHQGPQIRGADVRGGHLVDGNRVADRAGNEADVVPGQPAVGMGMTADSSLDMGQAREHGKPLAVMLQRLVRRGDRVVEAGLLGKP